MNTSRIGATPRAATGSPSNVWCWWMNRACRLSLAVTAHPGPTAEIAAGELGVGSRGAPDAPGDAQRRRNAERADDADVALMKVIVDEHLQRIDELVYRRVASCLGDLDPDHVAERGHVFDGATADERLGVRLTVRRPLVVDVVDRAADAERRPDGVAGARAERRLGDRVIKRGLDLGEVRLIAPP